MDPRVAKLVMKKKIEQRSREWYYIRGNLITASSASNLLIKDDTCDPYIQEYNLQDIFLKDKKCCNPYSSKTQFILDKVTSPKFKGSVATYHGQKYEDVVSDIYRNKFNTEIIDFGIIQHETYSWLGASPDGITPDGIMIEIKCPYRRKITGIPPLYYWIQVQLQLEVCDLDACDFIEYEFAEFGTQEEFLDDKTLDANIFHKGAIISIHKLDDGENIIVGESKYIYPPKNILDNSEKIVEWVRVNTLKLSEENISNNFKIEANFWKVIDFSNVRILRNKKWFNSVRPVFEKAWNEITYYKKGDNYKHLLSSIQEISDLDGKVLHLNLQNHCILSDNDSVSE